MKKQMSTGYWHGNRVWKEGEVRRNPYRDRQEIYFQGKWCPVINVENDKIFFKLKGVVFKHEKGEFNYVSRDGKRT